MYHTLHIKLHAVRRSLCCLFPSLFTFYTFLLINFALFPFCCDVWYCFYMFACTFSILFSSFLLPIIYTNVLACVIIFFSCSYHLNVVLSLFVSLFLVVVQTACLYSIIMCRFYLISRRLIILSPPPPPQPLWPSLPPPLPLSLSSENTPLSAKAA